MHKLLPIVLAAILATSTYADDSRLIAAIRHVESGGNDHAIGDGGRARGPYQIHRACWIDATQYGGVTWDYETMAHSEPHARQVMQWYWARYGMATDEAKARGWNAGPGWRRKLAATDGYWRRVRAAM